MKPLRFKPYYKSVVWGGSQIGAFKGELLPSDDIGESWEISGYQSHISKVESPEELAGMTLDAVISRYGTDLMGRHVYERHGNRFPLILKILDAHRDLSVQVHPNDVAAARIGEPNGKTEMWYILGTEGDAAIYAGFKSDISHDDLHRHIADGTLMNVIQRYQSAPGDVYFLPAGQVHATGAGNLLLEIQQTSDVTYRLYDYGRLDADGNPRPLHLNEAMQVLSLSGNQELKLRKADKGVDCKREEIICDCDYFKASKIEVGGCGEINNLNDSFMIVFCAEGEVTITDSENHSETLSRGQTILYPATSTLLKIKGSGTLLTFTA